VCWTHLRDDGADGPGLEHLLLGAGTADSVVLAFDEDRAPLRLTYRLAWDEAWQLHEADLAIAVHGAPRSLRLRTDGDGQWRHADGAAIDALKGCLDIDIWPTPFTNTFPIRRTPIAVGQRREFCMAWIHAPDLTVQPRRQAYTRLDERIYLFEALDGDGFQARLVVDDDAVVLDYPGLFQRIATDR
jgi:hypothetical protein